MRKTLALLLALAALLGGCGDYGDGGEGDDPAARPATKGQDSGGGYD